MSLVYHDRAPDPLVVFAYAFPHAKTYHGLVRLLVESLVPAVVIGAPKVPVTWGVSNFRTSPRGILHPTAAFVCRRFGWFYKELHHASPEAIALLNEVRPKVGLILGARILPASVIGCFEHGIVNLHPGVLPKNRGLDNVLRATLLGLPQAVTAHLISPRIDMGRRIAEWRPPLFLDDTFMDIEVRLLATQMDMIGHSVREALEKNPKSFDAIDEAPYNPVLTPSEVREALGLLPSYLQHQLERP